MITLFIGIPYIANYILIYIIYTNYTCLFRGVDENSKLSDQR